MSGTQQDRRFIGFGVWVVVGLVAGWVTLAAGSALAAPAASEAKSAKATQTVTRVHRLELTDISRLSVVNSVGSLSIQLGDVDRLEVTVEIKSDRRGWFSKHRDVSDIDIDIHRRGEQLRLALEQENVSGHWRVILPRKRLGLIDVNAGVGEMKIEALTAKLEIDLGVGEVAVRSPEGVIDVDVGVGDIKIFTRQANAGAVRGSVGVGEVTVSGEGVDSRGRGVVNIKAAGRGDNEIAAAAGVGDIEIVLTQP